MSVLWTQDLAVGVKVIDEQHKEIFRRVDGLLEACKTGKGKDAVEGTLNFMEDYLVQHFIAEENIQLHYAYPGYQLHKKEHEGFIRDVGVLREKFKREGPSLMMAAEISRTLVDWLVKHIKKSDMELGEFLKLSNIKH